MNYLKIFAHLKINITPCSLWSKEDYAKLPASISAVDWFFEYDGRSVNNCFLYLVEILQALIDRYVSVSSLTHVATCMDERST